MQIERIYFPVKTLGIGNRIGIWTVGCPHRCSNCSNPELWKPNPAKEIDLEEVFNILASINSKVDGITITGGEPFFQIDELAKLVGYIKSFITDDTLIYTGYTKDYLKSQSNEAIDDILNNISVLIDGLYIDQENDNAPLKGSANQKVYILNEKYRKQYTEVLKSKRTVQNIFYNNSLLSIVIPLKRYKEIPKALNNYGITSKQ